jgi:hypothetical protein
MEGYGLVSSDPSWTWVVEKQCFVSWTDDEGPNCLGELSPRNSTVKLGINIGWRRDSKEMLIALHLPISSRGSKYARDMFMIIPNTFDTSKLDTTFAPVQVPGRKDLDNAGFAYCNLFHIPATVAKPCDVIMPQTQRQKTLKGTPRVLVSKLKSLSEARAFDIYCRFDTFAQVELRKVFAKIDQLEMPLLLLDSMYDGRGAGINLWHHQGLVDLTPENTDEQPCAAIQQDIGLPPPYTAHVTPPPVDVQVPCSEVVIDPVLKSMDSAEEGVPESPFWVRMRRILDYKSPKWEAAERASGKRAASAEPLPDYRPTKRVDPCRTPLNGYLVREPSEPDCAVLETQHDTIPPADKLDESSWRPFASTPASLPVDCDEEKAVVMHHDASPPFDRSEEIAQWLYTAWTVLPSAHLTLRPQLLALGSACDTTSFVTLRIDVSTSLAFAAARTPSNEPDPPLSTNSDAEREVREVVAWVNGVRPDADSVMVKDLVTLAGAAMDVIDSVSDKEEKMQRFLVIKARCIGLACVLGGHGV